MYGTNLAGQTAEEAARTFAAVREALQKGIEGDDLAKSWVQSSVATQGLTQYSLEAPAKTLYPVLTPLRNETPRVTGGQGIQANWKAITEVNSNLASIGVMEGRRGSSIETVVADYYASFKGIGQEDFVTWEAQYASEGFDDARARASQGLLRSLMVGEERVILGGLGTWSLGTCPTPTLATATTGGSIGATVTVHMRCVALSLEGYTFAAAKTQIRGQVSETTQAGETITWNGGSSQASAAASIATGGGTTNVVTATVAPVKGAFGYAWFAGTAAAAGSQFLVGVTSINSFVLRAMPAGTEQTLIADLLTNDRSRNDLIFDGLISIALKTGSNGYFKAQATGTAGTGTPLTADGAGGIVEFDDALVYFWDKLKLQPTTIWVSGQEVMNLGKKILQGGANMAHRFTFMANQGGMTGSRVIRGYLSPFVTGQGQGMEIPILVHPHMPPGTVLMTTKELPYALSGVTDVYRMLMRRDYTQVEWPQRTRKHEYGIYADGVLQHYFPPSLGVITNIANG